MTKRDPLDDLLSDSEVLADSLEATKQSTIRVQANSGQRARFGWIVLSGILLIVTAVLIRVWIGGRNNLNDPFVASWNALFFRESPRKSNSGPHPILTTEEQNPKADSYDEWAPVHGLAPGRFDPRDVAGMLAEMTVGKTLTPEELYKKVSPSVVRVNVRNAQAELVGHGSGFFVRDDVTVVTNFHVIEGGHSADVVLQDGTPLSVLGVATFDLMSDVAILKVARDPKKAIHPLILGQNSPPHVASKAYVIGAPKGLDSSFSEGSVSAHREIDGRTWIQTTAAISPGSSGSPVFGSNGLVIGMATSSHIGGQNLNFALATGHIREAVRAGGNRLIKMVDVPSRQQPSKQAADPAKPADDDTYAAIVAAVKEASGLRGEARKREMKSILQRLESVPDIERQKVAFWTTLSFIHDTEGRRQLALDAADKAVRIDPNDKRGWQALAGPLQHPVGDSERRRLLEVEKKLIQFAGDQATDWQYVGLGDAFEKLMQYEEAVAAYGKALVRDPKCGRAYYGLGKVHKNRKKYPEAIASYKKSIEFSSSDFDSVFGYLGLAECFERMGDYREAIRAEEKALELLPEGFDDLEKNIRETLGRTRFLQAME